ncbi:MAG: hypothetical protein QM803_02270 [Rhodocyclaceae bacterium]
MTRRAHRLSSVCLVAATFLACPVMGLADGDVPKLTPMQPIFASARRLSDDALDDMRGGFETPGGLTVTFGIERAVYVNGELASVTTLNVGDLAAATAGLAPIITSNAAGNAVIVQNGAGNFVDIGALSGNNGYATIIQNSLDGQNLQMVTTIDARVNAMQLLRGELLTRSVTDAIANSLH